VPKSIISYRVFLASPGGLQEERKAFRREFEVFNERVALPRGVIFEAIGWEDTLGGSGRPQEIINEELRTCDYFVMLLWDRWGSLPDADGKFTSGTEEEFHVAQECLADVDRPMRQIAIFFKAVEPRRLSDPGDQLKAVIGFQKQLEESKKHLYHVFDEITAFNDYVGRFLNRWLLDHERGATISKESLRPLPEIKPSNPEPSVVSPEAAPSKLLADAQSFADRGLLTDAEALFARAVEQGTDPEAFQRYGDFLVRLGRLSQAQGMYEMLLQRSRDFGERWQVIALGALGSILMRRNNLVEAEQSIFKAIQLAKAIDSPRLVADQMRNLGNLYFTRGELKSAESSLREAIGIYTHAGQMRGLASAHNLLGLVRRERGDLDKAEESYREALILFRGSGNDEGVAQVLNNQGVVYRDRGEWQKALESFGEALKLNGRLGRTEGCAVNHRNLGEIYERMGDFSNAKHEFDMANTLYSELGLLNKVRELASLAGIAEERIKVAGGA